MLRRIKLLGSGTDVEEKRMSSKYPLPENVSWDVRPANAVTSPASRPPETGDIGMTVPSRATTIAVAGVSAETKKLMDWALAGTMPVWRRVGGTPAIPKYCNRTEYEP